VNVFNLCGTIVSRKKQVAQLSIHAIMSIERNTVVVRNAALGAPVVLADFECNGFIAVRFGINGVFCKENRGNTLRTLRIHGLCPCTWPVHGRVHGSTHGPYTAVYMFVDTGRVHDHVHRPSCTRHAHGRVHGPTRPVRGRVHGLFTAVYRTDTRPCTRLVYTAMYTPCTRPKTAVHTARIQSCSRAVYTGRVHGRYTAMYTVV